MFLVNLCLEMKILNGWADLDKHNKGVTLWAEEVQGEITKDEQGST